MKSTFRTPIKDSPSSCSFKKHDYMVHQHMLAHYRRLYSAKCGIDTSTPSHFKPRYKPKPRTSLPVADLASHPQLTNKDMKFLKSLAGEVRTWWNRSSSRQSTQISGERNSAEKSKENSKNSSGQERNHSGSLDQQSTDSNKQMSALTLKNSPKRRKDLNFKRCALAYGVSSKLREMSVYHPPRRRIGTGITNKYCGQCASKINKNSHVSGSGDIAATSNLFANEISSVIEEQKEELLYLQFIQEITQDILNNEIFSNEGVMIIFKKHISLNREKLDRDKMIKEIEKLGAKIGLPHYNYPIIMTSNRFTLASFSEMNGEIGDYEYYEDYHSKVKNSTSLTFNHKTNHRGDFNENTMSARGEIFEKNKKESKVLGFLEEMGFDSNIAEEICVCMTDKDFSKFQFTSNDSETNAGFHNDFVSAGEMGDYNGKKELPSKSVTELFHYCDAGFVFGDESKTQDNIIFDQEETIEMERLLESIHDNDVTQDGIRSIQAISSSAHSKSRESERDSTFVQENHSKKITTEQKSKANSSSPMGSDYSSMKDHDDSIYEGYSEEQDEGQESASEEAEEIPEDLSQSTVSSGISQITEKLKEFSVDMKTMLNSRSKERNNLSSENNPQSLRELVL